MKTNTLHMCVASAVMILLSISWARADLFDSEVEVFASDARANGNFGKSVAMSGMTAAVWGLNSNQFATVYVFQPSGTNWVQTQEITPRFGPFFSPANPNIAGKFVAMDDDKLLIGAPSASLENNLAFVYVRQGASWVFQQALDSGVIDNTFFGESVDISGTTAVVGAPDTDEPGAAYVFTQVGTNWFRQAVLTASDGTPQDQFGYSVAVDDGAVMVASLGTNGVGAVYVFSRVGTNWVQQQKLVAVNVVTNAAHFGNAIDIEGDVALIGAPNQNPPPMQPPILGGQFGAAYVFGRTNGIWTQKQILTPNDPQDFAFFGFSVALKDGVALIGAPGQGSDMGIQLAGAAYVFQQNGGNWTQEQQLFALSRRLGDFFAQSVALGDGALIVGAPFNRETAVYAGAAYLFTANAPPVITSAAATPSVLFPPNHKLVPVRVSVAAQGAVSCKIISVSSNEPINGIGDGNTSPDWIITGDLTLLLRAERSGPNKNGRVYTITVQCADALGNASTTNVYVTVPHDQGK